MKFLHIKNTTCEIKHSLGGINGSFDTGKKKISELQDTSTETT